VFIEKGPPQKWSRGNERVVFCCQTASGLNLNVVCTSSHSTYVEALVPGPGADAAQARGRCCPEPAQGMSLAVQSRCPGPVLPLTPLQYHWQRYHSAATGSGIDSDATQAASSSCASDCQCLASVTRCNALAVQVVVARVVLVKSSESSTLASGTSEYRTRALPVAA
jgi:hypothetical protein